MPATNKVSTQLLVSPHTRDRARALAIVRRESVAEVNRAALEGNGLTALEGRHRVELEHLFSVLAGMGVDRSAALATMLNRRMWVADLLTTDGERRKRFPGGLE